MWQSSENSTIKDYSILKICWLWVQYKLRRLVTFKVTDRNKHSRSCNPYGSKLFFNRIFKIAVKKLKNQEQLTGDEMKKARRTIVWRNSMGFMQSETKPKLNNSTNYFILYPEFSKENSVEDTREQINQADVFPRMNKYTTLWFDLSQNDVIHSII